MTYLRRRMAFTLVELLVVVGIIGVLVSIMIPVITRKRQEAHRSTCISNLRQCGIAFRMYMDDWAAQIPPRYEVAKQLLPVGITRCRMDNWSRTGPPMVGSYIYARGITGWIDCTDEQWYSRSLGDITFQRIYWLVDVFHTREGFFPPPDAGAMLPHSHWPSPLLALWLDGHVGLVRPHPADTREGTGVVTSPDWPWYSYSWVGIVHLNWDLLPGCHDTPGRD